MRPSMCSPAMTPAVVVAAALLLLLATPQPSLAKRFDCQMFCRTTGFNGMVGGCRCSFTLFTAKRAVRDHNSAPEEEPTLEDARLGHYFTLPDYLRMARETHGNLSMDDTILEPANTDHASVDIQAMPRNHPARLLVKANGNSATRGPSIRLGRSTSQILLKRKEFEQDLDNGDTTDYLRLPY
ncbi:uncharacterized protein LOC121853778 [Homarus americanus]|nr:uncharacterized protein LOC121853778 [Homarus americanus]